MQTQLGNRDLCTQRFQKLISEARACTYQMYWRRHQQTYTLRNTPQERTRPLIGGNPNGKDLYLIMVEYQSILYILDTHSRGLLRHLIHRPYNLLTSPQHNDQLDIRPASWPILGTFLLRNVNNIRVAWGGEKAGESEGEKWEEGSHTA